MRPRAQEAAPYLLGEIGGSFGDGGTAPAVAVGFGYLTARNVGFKIEPSHLVSGSWQPRIGPSVQHSHGRDEEVSDANLVLGAGAGLEFDITRHLAIGTSVRYQHVFSEPRSLDFARASVRASWRF